MQPDCALSHQAGSHSTCSRPQRLHTISPVTIPSAATCQMQAKFAPGMLPPIVPVPPWITVTSAKQQTVHRTLQVPRGCSSRGQPHGAAQPAACPAIQLSQAAGTQPRPGPERPSSLP